MENQGDNSDYGEISLIPAEVFNDFYTNKKASNQPPQMPDGDTPEGARTNDLNASGAKVQQNPETTKDSERKFFKTPDGHAYGKT